MRKIDTLRKVLRGLKRVVVAYSGGLDSTFLLKAAIDALGRDNVLAVTARSEMYPAREYIEAKKIARSLGARHLTINTKELAIRNFKENPVNRCYYCKMDLFKRLDAIRKEHGMMRVLDGTNVDDLKDIRHGRKAARQLSVKSPLLDAKIGKDDIRSYSKELGLRTWNKPSFACLASRFPFHTAITKGGLRSVGASEEYLRGLGISQVRVRAHGPVARIEVAPSDFAKLVSRSQDIVTRLRRAGFAYVAMDLAGYRTGSMHEAA